MIKYDETSGAYHCNDALSHSKLSTFLKRPTLYKKRHVEHLVDEEESRAMSLGTALHCSVLEPQRYLSDYATPPKVDRRTKDGKATYEAFCTENLLKTLISCDSADLVRQMTEAVRAHPIAAALIGDGKPEVTIRRDSKKFGLPMQCRIDWLGERNKNIFAAGVPVFDEPLFICDVKSCRSLEDFRGVADVDGSFRSRHFHKFNYARQQTFYQYVAAPEIGHTKFFFIAVESCEPFDCAVFTVPESYATAAWAEIDDGIKRLKECLASNIWPSGFEGVQEICAPKWAEAVA